jgi:hypothetical protein
MDDDAARAHCVGTFGVEEMLDLRLDVQPKTAQRLRKVLALAPDPETFAQNIIAYQITELKRGILNLRLDLKGFEEKYQRSTADFYNEFSQGKAGDAEDYIVWAGLYEMLDTNVKRLQELE